MICCYNCGALNPKAKVKAKDRATREIHCKVCVAVIQIPDRKDY